MKISGFFLAFFFLVLVAATSSAQLYKWIDEKGVVHFSDSPTQSASEAEVKEEISSPGPDPENNSPPSTGTRNITLDPDFIKPLDASKPATVKVDAPTVEIYETSWCGYCKKAKKFFRSRGIKFKAYDIEKDAAAADRMMALTKRRAVPFVVINGHTIHGYNVQAYEAALRN